MTQEQVWRGCRQIVDILAVGQVYEESEASLHMPTNSWAVANKAKSSDERQSAGVVHPPLVGIPKRTKLRFKRDHKIITTGKTTSGSVCFIGKHVALFYLFLFLFFSLSLSSYFETGTGIVLSHFPHCQISVFGEKCTFPFRHNLNFIGVKEIELNRFNLLLTSLKMVNSKMSSIGLILTKVKT